MFDITIENMNTNMVGRKLKGEQGNDIQDNNVTDLQKDTDILIRLSIKLINSQLIHFRNIKY